MGHLHAFWDVVRDRWVWIFFEVETLSYWLTERKCRQRQLCLQQRVPSLDMVVFCHGCNDPGFTRLLCHVLNLVDLLED